MGRRAEHVYTDQASIARLEQPADELSENSQVVWVMRDGSSYDGVVRTCPSVPAFRDDREREGINASVKLQRPDAPTWSQQAWLDQIVRVEHLDSTLAGES
jgi:hypothetical protein